MNYDFEFSPSGSFEVRELAVSRGDTFSIRLQARLGAGCRWELTSSHHEVIRLLDQAKVEPRIGLKPGATEIQVFRFIAEETGAITISFQYLRPWLRVESVLKQLEITALVT